MNAPEETPDTVAEQLKADPGSFQVAPEAGTVQVTLGVQNGNFLLGWSVQDPAQKDFVALYASPQDPDDGYLTRQWQWVANGSPYQTGTNVNPTYQARYLRYGTSGDYSSIARTPAFPNPVVAS